MNTDPERRQAWALYLRARMAERRLSVRDVADAALALNLDVGASALGWW